MSTTTQTLVELENVNHDSNSQRHSNSGRTLDDEIPDHAIDAIPDGGYGWVVVFACSLITFWFTGWSGSWGVLQAALLRSRLSDAPTSTLSFVGSLSLGLSVAFGLLSVHIARAITARYTALVGVILISMGMFLASFTTDRIGGMFATAGALIGVGSCLLFTVCNAVPVQWFSSKLGAANGLVKLGGGLGGSLLSLIDQALLDSVGIEWTFRILGFVCFATSVPAALLIKERVPTVSGRVLDISLFKSFPFLCLFLAGAVGTFALFVPQFFLPLFAHSIGLSASTGAGLAAGFSACAAVGRLGGGFACDRFGPVNMLLLAMSVNAVSMLAVWPVSSTLGPLLVFSMVNGVANGAYFSAMPTSVASVIGPGHASVAMSISLTGWTGGYLMGSPIAGMLISATGAEQSSSVAPYRAAIFYAGGVAFASGMFVFVARLTLDPNLRKRL